MGPPQRGIETGLVARLKRLKINGFHRRIQLLLPLRFAVFVGANHSAGREDFHAQESGIRTVARRFDGEHALNEAGLDLIASDHARRHQKCLAGMSILGEQYGLNIVIGPAVKNRFIGEDCDHEVSRQKDPPAHKAQVQ